MLVSCRQWNGWNHVIIKLHGHHVWHVMYGTWCVDTTQLIHLYAVYKYRRRSRSVVPQQGPFRHNDSRKYQIHRALTMSVEHRSLRFEGVSWNIEHGHYPQTIRVDWSMSSGYYDPNHTMHPQIGASSWFYTVLLLLHPIPYECHSRDSRTRYDRTYSTHLQSWYLMIFECVFIYNMIRN